MFLDARPLTPPDALVCPDAHDEDDDGVLDCRDNCPGVANADQPDDDDDEVGDACDPNRGASGDPNALLLFEPFANPRALEAWTKVGDHGSWTIENDQLVQMDDFADPFFGLLRPEPGTLPATLELRLQVENDTGSQYQSFHVAVGGSAAMRTWPHCVLAPVGTFPDGALTALQSYGQAAVGSQPMPIVAGHRYQIQLTQLDSSLRCTIDDLDAGMHAMLTSPLITAVGGGAYLGTHAMRIRVDYVALYGRRP